jgi:hypothetical protein
VALLSAQQAHACVVSPSDGILSDTENSQASADIVALVRVASSTQTQPHAARVELIVEHIWKGQVGARWTFTQSLDLDCDSALLRNVRYVIFANRQADGRQAGVVQTGGRRVQSNEDEEEREALHQQVDQA